MGYDYLVNLYKLDENYNTSKLEKNNIDVRRILSPNFHLLDEFIIKNFSNGWASEVKAALYKSNPSCFIAVKDNKEIIGFAAYDATGKGFFGPIGVKEEFQGFGIGKVLLLKSLLAMKEEGYGYAIIGSGSGKEDFYKKCVNAVRIEDNEKNIYDRLIH